MELQLNSKLFLKWMVICISCWLLLCPDTEAQVLRRKRITIDDDLPDLISEQFLVAFPGAQRVRWWQEEERFNDDDETPPTQIFYKVKFKLKKVKKTSVFDSRGNLMETTTVIKKKDLPAAVSKSFSMNFEGYGIRKLKMIEKGRTIYFEADILHGWTIVTCLFDSNGQLVEKVDHKARNPKSMSGVKR